MSKLKIDMNPNTKSLIDFVNNLKVQDREILTRRPLTQYLHRRSKPRSIIGTTATSPIKRPQSAVFKRNEKRSLTPNDLRVKIYSTEKDENERKYKEYISQVKNVSDMIDGSPLLQEFDQILEFEKSLHKLLTQKIKNLNNLLSLLDYNYEIVNKPNSSNLLSRLLYAASNCNKIRPIKEDYLNKVIYEACSKSNDTQDIDLSFLRRVQDCEKCGNSFYLRKNERIFVCHDCKGEKIGPKFEGIGVILEINAKNKTFPKSPEEMMTKKNTYIDTMNTERSQSSRPISARKIKAKFSLRDLKEDLETSNLITISGYGRSWSVKPGTCLKLILPSHSFDSQSDVGLFKKSEDPHITEELENDVDYARPLPEELIQECKRIKEKGKLINRDILTLLENQLNEHISPENLKEKIEFWVGEYSRHLRSIIRGMIDFIPEYSLALEKSIKGLFLLFEWIMHADLQKFRDVENKLTEQLQYKVEQVNFQREIKKVQSNMAEKEITYLDKIESLKFIKEKYETVIQMYEKELERREFDKEEDESIDINRPVKQNDKSFDFEKDIKSIKKSFMLLSNVIN